MDEYSTANAYLGLALWAAWFLVGLLPPVHIVRSIDAGEFDHPRAGAALVIIVTLAALTAVAAGTGWIYLWLGLLVLFGIVMPWLGTRYDKKLHRELDDRFINQCRTAVQCDQRNAGAHALLAEACATKQHYEEAVLHFEMALTLSPDPDYNPQYMKWVRHLEAARRQQRKWEAKQGRWRLHS